MCHSAGDVAKGDQPEGHAEQTREGVKHPASLRPSLVARHAVHQGHPPIRRQNQGHRVVRDLFNENVGNVGDRNAPLGRGPHVDLVHADAPGRYHLARFQRLDCAPREENAMDIHCVRVARLGDKLVLVFGHDLSNLDIKLPKGFHLQIIVGGLDATYAW